MYANDHAAQTLGFADAAELLAASPEEVRSRYELIDDYGRPLDPEELPGRRALVDGVADQRLVRFRIRGGPERVSLVRASPILGEDGTATACVNVFRDVTERHQANEGLRLLAETGALLAGSLDWEATLQGVARLAVPSFADWCIVDVIEGDREIRRVATAAANPRDQQLLDELRDRYSPTWDSPQPASRALRAAEVVVIEQFDSERLAETVRDDRHLELMTELDPQSAIALPLVARGQTARRDHVRVEPLGPPLRGGRHPARRGARPSRRAGDRQRPPLPRRAGGARAADVPRPGQLRARRVARLRADARAGGQARRPAARRLVRDRRARGGRRRQARRRRLRGPGEERARRSAAARAIPSGPSGPRGRRRCSAPASPS